ncbi:DUF6152 family protein [Azohydromonas australica]|uniref:DUF6152 family protein n=1 Tax=Azohydromonas australica TaxID=364039 RepID=UPI000410C292|nr:DUF6152 family protein [Azohydromonas australica]
MDLTRRLLVASGAVALLPSARAHHGWSSFDQSRPIYLEGAAREVRWRNPHAELVLELPPTLALPADLRQRPLPAQSASVDGPALLANAKLPSRKDKRWTVELAPLTRMQAWQIEPIKRDANVGVLGFTFYEEKGDPVLRAEYLFVDGKAYGLRSSPA